MRVAMAMGAGGGWETTTKPQLSSQPEPGTLLVERMRCAVARLGEALHDMNRFEKRYQCAHKALEAKRAWHADEERAKKQAAVIQWAKEQIPLVYAEMRRGT